MIYQCLSQLEQIKELFASSVNTDISTFEQIKQIKQITIYMCIENKMIISI
ncbi:hypothetical protein SN4111_05030 [Ligilactobacillus agilis]|nr:hypothetical protein SN4111_05030 [Ligilactobacillus agilis]